MRQLCVAAVVLTAVSLVPSVPSHASTARTAAVAARTAAPTELTSVTAQIVVTSRCAGPFEPCRVAVPLKGTIAFDPLTLDDVGLVGDRDDDGLDEVTTTMTGLSMSGESPGLGPVTVTLRDPNFGLPAPSVGVIEETEQVNEQQLDGPPRSPGGFTLSLTAFIDVAFRGNIFRNDDPIALEGTLQSLPPAPGDEIAQTEGTISLSGEDVIVPLEGFRIILNPRPPVPPKPYPPQPNRDRLLVTPQLVRSGDQLQVVAEALGPGTPFDVYLESQQWLLSHGAADATGRALASTATLPPDTPTGTQTITLRGVDDQLRERTLKTTVVVESGDAALDNAGNSGGLGTSRSGRGIEWPLALLLVLLPVVAALIVIFDVRRRRRSPWPDAPPGQ